MNIRRRPLIAGAMALFCGSRFVAAQTPAKIWRIGYLSNASGPDEATEALRAQMTGLGYQEGRNLLIEYCWGAGREARLAELTSGLVRIKVDVIVVRGQQAAAAAKRATSTVPIVMAVVGDPVGTGLVANLAHPGGNITGVGVMATDLAGKRVQLLRELLPKTSRLAVLVLKGGPGTAPLVEQLQAAALQTGITLAFQYVNEGEALAGAFAAWRLDRAQALMVQSTPFSNDHRKRIVELAMQHKLPMMFDNRGFVDVGGLMSYGTNVVDLQRRVASYVDKILKGAKPADLPVEQPSTFELVINLKTAKALGITIPQSLLLRADEVIQ